MDNLKPQASLTTTKRLCGTGLKEINANYLPSRLCIKNYFSRKNKKQNSLSIETHVTS